MFLQILDIQYYFMKKTGKQRIEDLDMNECKGFHTISIQGKDHKVEVTEDGRINIIKDE